jgi:hypothetical protein
MSGCGTIHKTAGAELWSLEPQDRLNSAAPLQARVRVIKLHYWDGNIYRNYIIATLYKEP